jgi:outer membrane protein OmpA-like peptidoglycan-associated protein
VGTVHFTPGGSHVNARELRAVAAAVARIGRADRLVLTAHTDPSGSLAQNRRLAALRADSVVAALAARGLDPAQVIVLSRPRCGAARPLPERDAAQYRRVDIERLTQRATLSEEPGHGQQPRA